MQVWLVCSRFSALYLILSPLFDSQPCIGHGSHNATGWCTLAAAPHPSMVDCQRCLFMSCYTAFLDCHLDGLRWASCLRAAPPPSPLVPKAQALLLHSSVCGSRTVPGMVFPLSGGPAWGAYPRARAALAHVTLLVTLSVCCKVCPFVCDPSAACLCACAATRSASLLSATQCLLACTPASVQGAYVETARNPWRGCGPTATFTCMAGTATALARDKRWVHCRGGVVVPASSTFRAYALKLTLV